LSLDSFAHSVLFIHVAPPVSFARFGSIGVIPPILSVLLSTGACDQSGKFWRFLLPLILRA
jgi:hypothetical protein